MTLPIPQPAPASFSGMRVALVGLGIEGRDAALFLQSEGAEITAVDRRGEAAARAELDAIGVAAETGAPDDPGLARRVDAIVASQGVPWDAPLPAAAACAGMPIYGPMGIFLDRCPADVIGVSGSAGKSTTTALIGRMLEAAGREPLVGGNIGRGMLRDLPQLGADDAVVAEISHTQLLRAARSPRLAVLLNVTPNHLDQFSWDEYVALKRRLVEHQRDGDIAVLPFDEPVAAAMAGCTAARTIWSGIGRPPGGASAAFALDDSVRWRDSAGEHEIVRAGEIRLQGEHNLRNALAATAAAAISGIDPETISDVLRSYEGLAHRLEFVAEIGGVRYVNDSIATAPERALAGLRAIAGPVVLLLGGRGKNLPFDGLAAEAAARAGGISAVYFGEDGAEFASELGLAGPIVDDLDAAVRAAAARAAPGSTVLMSPAGTSFDAYPNFEARGAHFRAAVRSLAEAAR